MFKERMLYIVCVEEGILLKSKFNRLFSEKLIFVLLRIDSWKMNVKFFVLSENLESKSGIKYGCQILVSQFLILAIPICLRSDEE